MNDAAAPLREEVRSHKVVGTLRGRKTGKNDTLWVNDASQANRQDKAPTSGSGDGPTLTRLDNGKIRLAYSVEKHTKYRRSEKRDPYSEIFGYKLSEWNKITFSHEPIRRAFACESNRQDSLDNVRCEGKHALRYPFVGRSN